MLDGTAAEAADRSPVAATGGAGSRRRRQALAGCAALVLLLHGAFLGGATGWTPDAADPGSVALPLSVRTVAAEPEAPVEAAETPGEPPPVAPPPPPARPRLPHRSREPVRSYVESAASAATAGARFEATASELASAALEPVAAKANASAATSSRGVATAPPIAEGEATPPTPAAIAPLLAAGESPPPVYRTRLPPSATLRYEVRRGYLRGTGEIRWRPAGDDYRLVLEARISGLTLLIQTSEGAIDTTGLAPTRLVDQRARRSAQAANFSRELGKVTFSGPAVVWPLLPGTQDRLSWMIQLAGIVAAEPELLVDGLQIRMVVVGARGEAEVWVLRYAGRETVETARATVRAVKFVRDGHLASDTSAEIWLDPARDYFPAHATLRNSSGGSEYDLLLERIEAPP
jgi:hypothetical protein